MALCLDNCLNLKRLRSRGFKLFVLFVNFAPVSNARDAHQFCYVVDQVDYAPFSDADTPLIFVALQFFTSRGSWRLGQGFEFADNTRQHAIWQRFKFLPSGGFYFDTIAIHAADRV